MKRKEWSIEEDEILSSLARRHRASVIAGVLGRPVQSVLARAYRQRICLDTRPGSLLRDMSESQLSSEEKVNNEKV